MKKRTRRGRGAGRPNHVWLIEGNNGKFVRHADDDYQWATGPFDSREQARTSMRKTRKYAQKKYAAKAYKFRVVKYVFEKADVGP